VLALDDEEGVEHRHSAVEIERKELFRIRVGAGEFDAVSCHILPAYSKMRRFSTRTQFALRAECVQ
jgi:hypothetical protein